VSDIISVLTCTRSHAIGLHRFPAGRSNGTGKAYKAFPARVRYSRRVKSELSVIMIRNYSVVFLSQTDPIRATALVVTIQCAEAKADSSFIGSRRSSVTVA